MLVKELLELKKNQFSYVELFTTNNKQVKHFHTDTVRSYNPNQGYGFIEADKIEMLNSTAVEMEVLFYNIMTNDEYDKTILANTGVTTKDLGFNENEKTLCIAIDEKINLFNGELID